ncbi:MAG: flagellar assembly peptidoglycan hydrolase FlgJ [Thiobacillus sp.]
MLPGADLSSKFALDVQGVNQLKLDAKAASPESLKAAAKQFEAVFMNMLMKSMREATPQDGLFGSEQTRMYTSMLDQQLSQTLSSRGIGLAEIMVRQLSASSGAPAIDAAKPQSAMPLNPEFAALRAAVQSDPVATDAAEARTFAAPIPPTAKAEVLHAAPLTRSGNTPAHVEAFVQRLLPHAQHASQVSGIPASFMLGQAALETGWGRSEIRSADGQNSHNLFGIKAGGNWQGKTVDITTTEYVGGKPVKQIDSFRAYDSYADAFSDYARLLRSNARYQPAIATGTNAADFAHGLQRAGYATDPNYATKLMGAIRLASAAG